jgi:hypothetical protein
MSTWAGRAKTNLVMFFSRVKVNQPMNKGIREHVAQIRQKLDEFENLASLAGSGDGEEEEGEEREAAEEEEEEEEEGEGEEEEGGGVWVVATPPDPAVQLQLRRVRNMVELLAQINAALYGRRRRPAVDVRHGADTLDARREFWGRTAAPVHAVVGFSIQSTGGDEGAREDEEDEDEDEDKEEDKDEEEDEDVRVDAGGGE